MSSRGSPNIYILVVSLSLLAGCMVGPDFHSPAAPKTQSYTKDPLPAKTVDTPTAGKSGKAQEFVSGADISAQWWALFHSESLNQLIEAGLAHSPNYAAAEAALKQAQYTLYSEIGALLIPAVTGQATGERQRFSGSTFGFGTAPNIFSLYNTSVNVSYTLDVFGGLRRQIEAQQAQVTYQQYQLAAAYLTLTSNIVTTAIAAASYQAQIVATKELIEEESKSLTIVRQQFELGGISGADVYSQQTQLEQTRATLPPLQQQLAQANHALAVLIGELPSESSIPTFELAKLNLPTKLPLSLPSSFVRQRPDVQAAEALLHQASAQIGVATANLLPQFTLNAAYGAVASSPGQLFKSRANVWDYTGQITQPIFEGGSLYFQRKAAIAAYQQSYEQYKQTVLVAFQNVADVLRALENDARTLHAQKTAETAAKKGLYITQKQFALGGISYLSLLSAEQQYQQTLINLIQAQAARYADTAALFQALGGGWWNYHPENANAEKKQNKNEVTQI